MRKVCNQDRSARGFSGSLGAAAARSMAGTEEWRRSSAERKNGVAAISAVVISVIKNRLSISPVVRK